MTFSLHRFVCALTVPIRKLVAIRNYSPRELVDIVSGCKIWEAARATSAAPSFFDPITVGYPAQKFAEGGIGANNPVHYVLREAADIWPDAQDRVQCLLSIGTWNPGLQRFGNNLMSIGRSLVALVTETTRTANRFANEHEQMLQSI